MTIREAIEKLGYDFGNMVQPPLVSGLSLDTDIAEHGMVLSEKLCTPGCGCWAVVVEVQLEDDWGMSRPWVDLYFKESEAKLNPCEWGFETRWYRPGELERR